MARTWPKLWRRMRVYMRQHMLHEKKTKESMSILNFSLVWIGSSMMFVGGFSIIAHSVTQGGLLGGAKQKPSAQIHDISGLLALTKTIARNQL